MPTNDLTQLRRLLTQDDAGLHEYVYSLLQFGDMWWVPDSRSAFGSRDRHPWVVIGAFTPNQPTVMVCPRTSQLEPPRGLLNPANILEGLDRPGLFLYSKRQIMNAIDFRDFDYIGRLPESWKTKLREYLRTSRGKGRTIQ